MSVLMVFAITAQMGLTVSAEPAAEESAAGAEAPADEEDVVLDESVVDQLTDGTQDPFDYTDDRARSALLRSADALPDSLDLRDVDGKSYVTPVKSQAPFGTCWSFAAVASAEGSVLAAGLKGSDGNTASADTLDLSEKQLAYFSASALNDPTNSQNGEGQSVEDFITTEQLMDRGGNAIIATSVFAQGIGPDHESTTDYFEYRGKNAYIESEEIDGVVQKYCYSDDDDWSIPEEFRFCSAYSLRESKILPAPAGRDEKGFYKYNEAGTAAIKRELSAHRSVLVCFCADASLPTTEPGSSQYISANWAHYTYEPLSPSHAVTIVGWDDHYPRDNFLHGEVHYDTQDGPVVFDKTPPADGAWLVKNSWGAGTEVFPNKGAGKWGIENAEGIHTGYFWISYYDQSLLSAGSFIFEEGDSDDIITQQYDYMPEILAMGARTQDETRMGNVFCARESMKLEAVSGFTTYPGTEVTYEVYLLDDQHSIGPDRGIKAAEKTVTYEFGGFHRENIDQENLLIDTSGVGKGLYIMKNQMYAVVVTQRLPGGDYVVNFQAAGKNEGGGVQSMKGIINGEESYIFMNGNWRDYGDNPSIREDLMNAVNRSDFPIDETNFNFDSLTFDNFPIKAYGRKLGTDAYMELSFSKRVYYGWDDERALLSFYSSQTDISDYDINRESISWHLEDGSKEDEKIRLSDDPARFTRQIITAKEAAENEYMYVTVNGLGTVVGLISAGRLALGFDMFLPNDENGKQKFFYDYTGDPVEPEASIYSANVKRLLTRGEHFDLSYENNIKCGAATVTATAKGVMRPGQVSLPFMILPPKAKIKDVTVSGNSMTVLVEDQSSTGTEGYRFRYRKKGSGEWTEVSG
ncbi:MAG: C1 family peptidase, partial [Eubacteriales bacterium]|nr:C1 family peptidase [Eubacteriales bacterium]